MPTRFLHRSPTFTSTCCGACGRRSGHDRRKAAKWSNWSRTQTLVVALDRGLLQCCNYSKDLHAISVAPPMLKPSLFIGSSAEGLEFARAVRSLLDDAAETTLWDDGVFRLGFSACRCLLLR